MSHATGQKVDGATASPTSQDAMAWQVDVSVLGNRLVRRSLVRGFGLSAVLSALLIGGIFGFASGEAAIGLKAGGFAAAATVVLFVVGLLFYFLIVGARQPYAYRMDDAGIEMINASRAAKRVHRAAFVLGFLAGKPGAASAGAAAMASESMYCAWSEVKRVDDLPADRALFVRGGPLTKVYVFCTPENHAEVRAFVLAHAKTA
jgi:hypothetical protein